jgi:hypothetical protein
MIIIIIIIIIIVMALQPVVEPWPLFHFLDPIQSGCRTMALGSTQPLAEMSTMNL